jgi:RNA polymerase sigma-70 factor (ECF subfamily)
MPAARRDLQMPAERHGRPDRRALIEGQEARRDLPKAEPDYPDALVELSEPGVRPHHPGHAPAGVVPTPGGTTVPVTPETVFREHAPRIYHVARRLLGNDADAEDVTQDVLLQVVRKLGTFRGESQLSTWLHRVTVNVALAHRQRRANRRRETAEAADERPEAAAPSGPVKRWNVGPDEPVLAAEQAELIGEAIARLPVPCRDVFVLADVEGLPNAEIADVLGLSVPAVKSRLHRARLRMRDALAPHFEVEGGIAT